jgi:hypothetical protein
MNKISFFIFIILMTISIQAQTPAFPGAEGYGKYVTGGRGGRVVYVTQLKDATDVNTAAYKGSLRAALETSGNDPITVVFKCGGVINPVSSLVCSRSNITIAGQTALGDGICVIGYGIKFTGNNVIVRYMRFRVGDRIEQNDPALTFSNGKNAIFDHCSFSWSVEENVNITDVDSVTLQWCINSESLYNSTHAKGARAYAAQWGGEHASYHHNLLAHHNTRMPRQNGNTSNDYQLTWDYRNNVHYNWHSDGAFYGGGVEQLDGFSHSNIVNNYYKPGPSTTNDTSKQYFCAPSGGRTAVVGDGNDYLFGYGLWYLNGNYMYNNSSKTNNNWAGLLGSTAHYSFTEFEAASVTTSSATEAYTEVLSNAGATKPVRDTFDVRIISEVQSGTAVLGGLIGDKEGIIDTHRAYMSNISTDPTTILAWEKTLYPEVKYTKAPADVDGDGIPNWWEALNSLDSTKVNDGSALASDGSGYTNLEIYLNSEDVGKSQPTATNNLGNSSAYCEIYPNPVSFSLNVSSLKELRIIQIFDLSGKLVAYQNLVDDNTVSVAPLLHGEYIARITFSDGTFVMRKIIKL